MTIRNTSYGLVVLSLFSLQIEARAAEGEETPSAGATPGTVYTFYGLRKLEQDPAVADKEKLQEWTAFIDRAEQQIVYARKAVLRWKNAARLRVVEAALESDRSSTLTFRQKIERWDEVGRFYPGSADAKQAQRRAAHWREEETKRLVQGAEKVERAQSTKLERIAAWKEVLAWAPDGAEGKAARRRISTLQDQLYAEAVSVDGIRRVAVETKLEAWRDVFEGAPTEAQKTKAAQRIRELEQEMESGESDVGK
jgi:hypothetical protein